MIVLLAGVVLTGPVDAGAASTQDPSVARVLIVGDSVTQGRAGDYTWRYRLWKALQAQRASVDFVGPRTELADGTTDYADPDFDSDHAARWGAMITTDGWWVSGYPEDVTGEVVAAYQPDVVVEDLGVNNLLHGGDPAGTISLLESFVADVRSQNPHASVVLGQLTQRWFTGVDTFNAMLVDLASRLDRADARVVLAEAPADYTADGDTYDSSHPNAQGEVKIAQQFQTALAQLALPVVPPPAGPQPRAASYVGAARLVARGRRHSVRLRFSTPPGATGQVVWMRDRSAGGRWRAVASVSPGAHRKRVGHLRSRHHYAFRLRAYQDASPSTTFSNLVRVRVR